MLEAMGKTEFFSFVLTIIFANLSIWVATKIAGIKNATFGKSIIIVITTLVLIFIGRALFLNVIMKNAPDSHKNIWGYFTGMLTSLFIIRAVYRTTFGRAFLLLLFFFASNIVALIISAEVFMGGIGVLLNPQGY
jgi:hypothetical protein